MNIASRIEAQAKLRPQQIAVKFPKKLGDDTYLYKSLTFKELNDRSSHYASYLRDQGIVKGNKVLLFVRPSLDFSALVFAIFKLGAVPVLIDPGMGRKNLITAIKQVAPDALMAVPEVHFMRIFFKEAFAGIKTFISTGIAFNKDTHTLRKMKKATPKEFITEQCDPEDMAAILFTSGGTGIPKGVVYTHKIFNKQTDILQEMFSLTDKDIDLPGFPLFSFFTMAMGMTSCIPDMNPSKPAKCKPMALVQNIADNNATFVAGSPAIWERVADYCLENNLILPSVKYLVMFGAPVRVELHKKLQRVLTNGTTYTPYGATEALPISNVSGKYILENTAKLSNDGNGTCIGTPAPGIEIKIIKAHDRVITSFEDIEEVSSNQVGEIIVRGDVVTKEYYKMPDKALEAKIKDGDTFWHRMGDVGYFDEQGRLWFMGRKIHRLELEDQIKYSIPVEAIFNNHLLVRRSALVGIQKDGKMKPAIVIEPNEKYYHQYQFKKDLMQLGSRYKHTQDIENIYFMEKFPVDIRHNIKIDRKLIEKLVNAGKVK
ncbi:fatty acid CoA ligase family protein [Bacteriovorax sp. Seq25_V]|uniref:fatty acid CoA ligase family protein n=1 Tax=Bacteriovorax sp. Seq25_V TaxID=1201288 RepID=UPI00038A55B2|nr:fatty acid CoA ligase family protein [Bacteriovorax sp. Seq25_V]EQC44907.1 AMP-binding enzyme [Bacteriovorax sp. Seq25_V]